MRLMKERQRERKQQIMHWCNTRQSRLYQLENTQTCNKPPNQTNPNSLYCKKFNVSYDLNAGYHKFMKLFLIQ